MAIHKHTQTLGKPEKLKSRKQIDQLFKARKFVTAPPVRLFYQIQLKDELIEDGQLPGANHYPPKATIQVGFGCSKKFFKQATRRNRVKRLLREAYRTQKAPLWQLCQEHGCTVSLFWLYGHKELPTLQEMNEKVATLLELLAEKLKNKVSKTT